MYIVVPIIDQFSKTETLSSSKFDGIKHHLSGQDQRLHPNPPRFFFFVFFSPSLLLHCLLIALLFTSIMSGKSYLLL